MSNEKKLKGQNFRPWTKEEIEEDDRRTKRVLKKASENLKKGIYPGI